MSFRLDIARNELLIVDMTLATLSLTFSIGNFVVGAFGMNLISGLEQVRFVIFWSVFIGMFIFIGAMSHYLLNYFKLTGTHPVISQTEHTTAFL
jgi:Mg2+ and Co2+ transporter CorA